MNSLTRIPILLAAATLVLLGLAACSSVGSSGSAPAPQGSPSPTAEIPLRSFATIDMGDQSGVAGGEMQIFKIETQAEWDDFWSRHQGNVSPAPPAPSVDFSKEMVIAVVDQQQPSGGFQLDITEIVQGWGSLSVLVDKAVPGPDCIVTMALTKPFHIVKTARTTVSLDLVVTQEPYSCG